MRRPFTTGCLAIPLQCPAFPRCLNLSTANQTSHPPRSRLTPRSLSAMRSRRSHRRFMGRGTPLRILLLLKLRTLLLRPHPRHLRLLSVLPQLGLKNGTTLTWRCWARRTPSSFESCWRDRTQRLSCLLTHLGHCLRLLFLHYYTAYVSFIIVCVVSDFSVLSSLAL